METNTAQYQHTLDLVHTMLGKDKDFRPGQWEAIKAVAIEKQRTLLVQRTGWGKSLVYFLATRLLREQGAGPTLLISPLLALMRNQVEMAERIGIQACTINSTNKEKWAEIEEKLSRNEFDLMLVAPERLNNTHFLKEVLPRISGSIGLFVVDEAHCISDWGHDFRPDYRRIVRIIKALPRNMPVLGTTATANNRVVDDVHSQLGPELKIIRGPLDRESLRLQNIRLGDQSERLAWLAENLPKFPSSGIIYCLTRADTERVAAWLNEKGFSAASYHAGDEEDINRAALESAFLNNEIKILVATVALGMGFDKPDIGFVIHFQRPGSVVAYYQQVGRAGRALERSYGILLNGAEDDEIQDYFIQSAFPPAYVFKDIISALERENLSIPALLSRVNTTNYQMEKALKLLELDQAVYLDEVSHLYIRTPNPWKSKEEEIKRILDLRRAELVQMQEYVEHEGCLMEFLLKALDDPNPTSCGRCANCKRKGLSNQVSRPLVLEAEAYLKSEQVIIKPRKQWPYGIFSNSRKNIPEDNRNEPGRALCHYGDTDWGKLVREGKYVKGFFSDELVDAAVNLILEKWKPDPEPEWVTAIPSHRHPELVPDFAIRLAKKMGIPFDPVLKRMRGVPEQKTMQNSTMQAANVKGSLGINGKIRIGPVLLVDDIIDSGWTLTAAGYLLRTHGSGAVYPFTLASASKKDS